MASSGRQSSAHPRRALIARSAVWCAILAVPASFSAQSSAPQSRTIATSTLESLPVRMPEAKAMWTLSDTDVEFGRVAAGCLAGNGSAVILSSAPRALIVVPDSGARGARTLGKGGSGPGEFERPWALSCFDQDSAAVLELARITLVSLREESLESFAIQPVNGGRWLEVVGRLSGGRYLLRRREVPERVPLGTVRDTVELTVATGLSTRAPAFRQILRAPEGEVVRVQRGRAMTTSLHPFGRALLVATNDSVVHYIDTGTNRLVTISTDGATISRVTLETHPRALDRRIVERQRRQAPSTRRSAQQLETDKAIQEATMMPTYLPAFDRLVALRSGGVLIRQFVAPGDTLARWLELDARLVPRARWHIDPNIRLLAADSTSLLGLRSGDDANEIVRWALTLVRGR